VMTHCQIRRLLWPCMSLLLVVSLGCGGKKDPAPTGEGSNPPAAATGDTAGDLATPEAGATGGQSATQEIDTPEELARRSFEAFTSKDRDSARKLTMAGLTVESWEELIRQMKETEGHKGPAADQGKSVSEIAAKELGRVQANFEQRFTGLHDKLQQEGLDVAQATFVKYDIGRPSGEMAARMKEDIPFDFADITVVFELAGKEHRLRVDDCFKLPGVGWRAQGAPFLAGFEDHAEGESSEADGHSSETTADSSVETGTDSGDTTVANSAGNNATTVSEGRAAPVNATIGFEVGNQAPEITGEDIDGKKFKLSDYRGKVVLLDFWGDW